MGSNHRPSCVIVFWTLMLIAVPVAIAAVLSFLWLLGLSICMLLGLLWTLGVAMYITRGGTYMVPFALKAFGLTLCVGTALVLFFHGPCIVLPDSPPVPSHRIILKVTGGLLCLASLVLWLMGVGQLIRSMVSGKGRSQP